ncbi:WD domain G-beta repeat containing protein [Babesia bovis T2Bo]|uniref:Coronin n=1 Tax=Babesia bovis TaxID=5865 RepID=Q7YZH0_BABBO|nr:WD domain G-beta repeat containing protein [Babesia bovis T2Bo]AAP85293.1 coronin-like protein [Babesia bovis]EDO08429.1 WD domain G-beta repeat containing protein [Babesia bovis T2Bo]|eukprot:XP_001611997.1 WD domain, G-beta repeat containing protein [Babesia bovis T2Bo]
MSTVKLKNLFGEPFKQVYCDLKINPKPTAFSGGMAASPTYVAFPWEVGGGGLVSLIGLDKLGRNSGAEKIDLRGHAGSLQDMVFNDFDYSVLATGSDDCSVRVWRVGNNEGSALCNLAGHTKKTTNVVWNASTDYVLLSGSMDNTVKVWDVKHGSAVSTIPIEGNYSYCNWSYDGNTVLVSTKESYVAFADPRDGKVKLAFKAHDSNKATSVQWLGGNYGGDYLATTGYVGNQTRQIRVWDARNTDKPVVSKDIDSAPGPLIPYWDSDTGLLTVVGKGDLTVRIFQYLEGDLNRAGEFKCNGTIKSFCFLPNSACDKSRCELGRLLYNCTSKEINPISIVVLRRNSQAAMGEIYGNVEQRRRTLAEEWHGCDLGAPQKSISATFDETAPPSMQSSFNSQVSDSAKARTMLSVASPSADWESTATGKAFIEIVGHVNHLSIRYQPAFNSADMLEHLENLEKEVVTMINLVKKEHGISTPSMTSSGRNASQVSDRSSSHQPMNSSATPNMAAVNTAAKVTSVIPKPKEETTSNNASDGQAAVESATKGLTGVKAAIAAMEARRAQAKGDASGRKM